VRITVEAPFDLGLTFGLGGSAFEGDDRLQALKLKSAEIFKSPVLVCTKPSKIAGHELDDFAATSYGVRQPFGFGVRLQVLSGGFTKTWMQNALQFWSQYRAALLNEFGEETYQEVEEKLPLVVIPYAVVIAFELGIAYVRLHLDPPPTASAEVARAIFKAFENAGYGDLVAGESANSMLAAWRTQVREIYGRDAEIAVLTERRVSPKVVEIAGFQGVVLSKDPAAELGDEPRLFRIGDVQVPIRYGDLSVTATWLITLVSGIPGFEYDHNRFLHIGMCHRLAWETCRVFEEVFAEKMRLAITASVENDRAALSRKQLNRIRQFAALVLSMTSVENMSDYSGDLEFSRFFDSCANISKRHHRIALAASALADVEADIVVTDDRKVSRSVNVILLLLTIVSLVGVSAGVIQSWESGLQLFKTPYMLLVSLVTPSLVAMIAILASRGISR
jgi:hypothetical protein